MAIKKQIVPPPKAPSRPAPTPARPAPGRGTPTPSRPAAPPPSFSGSKGLGGILGNKGTVTQHYGQQSQYDIWSGQKSPAYEVAVPVGTSLATPPGRWQVVQAFNGASKKGYIGNFEGQGWGNNVRLKNVDTGETIGYNHMNDVGVQVGQVLGGGYQVGSTGMSGNATGPHVAITYHDPQGRAKDFEQTNYAGYINKGIPEEKDNGPMPSTGHLPATGDTSRQISNQGTQTKNIPSMFNQPMGPGQGTTATAQIGLPPVPSQFSQTQPSNIPAPIAQPQQQPAASNDHTALVLPSTQQDNQPAINPAAQQAQQATQNFVFSNAGGSQSPESTKMKNMTPAQIIYGGQNDK